MKVKYVVGIVLLLCVCSAFANDDESAWENLNAAQQEALAPFSQEWDKIPRKRRQHLIRGAKRLARLGPAERAEAVQRLLFWRELSGERRDQIRERYEIYKSLSPAEQRRLKENFRHFNRMNRDRRQKMRARYRDMTPEQRRRMRERARHRQRPANRD